MVSNPIDPFRMFNDLRGKLTVIYSIYEPYRIQKFKNFDELMKKYSIYNESLKMHINDIMILSKKCE